MPTAGPAIPEPRVDFVVEFEHSGLQGEHGNFRADDGDDACECAEDGEFSHQSAGDQVAGAAQSAHQRMLLHASFVARLYRCDEHQGACPEHQAKNQLDGPRDPIDDAFDLGDDRVHLDHRNGRMRRKQPIEEPLAVGFEMETGHVRCRKCRQCRTREHDKEIRLQAIPLDPAQIRYPRGDRQPADVELQHVAYAQTIAPRVVHLNRNQCFDRIGGPPIALFHHIVAGHVIGPCQVSLGAEAPVPNPHPSPPWRPRQPRAGSSLTVTTRPRIIGYSWPS